MLVVFVARIRGGGVSNLSKGSVCTTHTSEQIDSIWAGVASVGSPTTGISCWIPLPLGLPTTGKLHYCDSLLLGSPTTGTMILVQKKTMKMAKLQKILIISEEQIIIKNHNDNNRNDPLSEYSSIFLLWATYTIRCHLIN